MLLLRGFDMSAKGVDKTADLPPLPCRNSLYF
jgi:hypothetical protein